MRGAAGRVLLLAVAASMLAACAPGGIIERVAAEVRARGGAPAAAPTATAPEPGSESLEHAAIQLVIHRGNFQQEQALAARDPAIMRDTASESYYQELAQTNRDLLSGGVTRIKLVQLEWGPIVLRGTRATATTYETWTVTFVNGTTQQSRDRNVYRLVQREGNWKIQSNEHPDGPSTLPPGGPEVNFPLPPGERLS